MDPIQQTGKHIMASPKKIFIIDAMAMIFRNFHAFSVRPLSRSSDGHLSSALYGCTVSLLKIIEEEKPDYLVIASDSAEKTLSTRDLSRLQSQPHGNA